MADDDKPDPIEDVRKGIGLFLRAAKTTLEKLPTKDFEEAVVTGAREVGRAIENVSKTIEKEVFGGGHHAEPPSPAADAGRDIEVKAVEPKAEGATEADHPRAEPPPPTDTPT